MNSIKNSALYVFTTVTFLFTTTTSFAETLEVKNMNCTISNFFGVEYGSAVFTDSRVHLKMGLVENFLWVLETKESSIRALTKTQNWDYVFSFTDELALEQSDYQGTLYQQYAMGFMGPLIPLGKLNCSAVEFQ